MKKLLILLIVIITFAACNDGNNGHDNRGCVLISKDSLTVEQKALLLEHGWDSTKCYTIEP